MHLGGKIEMLSKLPLKTRDDLSMAYTPGVARVCQAIADDRDCALNLTIKKNTVAVVTDGTAVLGLGDIGPEAAMPVMEGKAMLFKEFGGVDAFPICLDTKDADEIVADREGDRARLRRHQPRGHLRAALLRDRGAAAGGARHPRLPRRPARHGDRRPRGALNALQVVGKQSRTIKVVVTGVGAAGVAVTDILLDAGVRTLIGCDRRARLRRARGAQLPSSSRSPSARTRTASRAAPTSVSRRRRLHRPLGARRDLGAGIERMADDAIVFAMANPTPEIAPEELPPGKVAVVATGRSDYPNQINNVLAFPGSSAARSTSAPARSPRR